MASQGILGQHIEHHTQHMREWFKSGDAPFFSGFFAFLIRSFGTVADTFVFDFAKESKCAFSFASTSAFLAAITARWSALKAAGRCVALRGVGARLATVCLAVCVGMPVLNEEVRCWPSVGSQAAPAPALTARVA